MSVFVAVPPTLRPFRGSFNPSHPAGFWAMRASVLGDSSGGLMTISIHFQEANDPRPSLYWNMEHVDAFTTVNGDQNMRCNVFNMDPLPEGESDGSISRNYHFGFRDLGSAALGAATADVGPPMPVFLGSPAKNANNATTNFAITNVDAASLSVGVQGYYWGPSAVWALGGLARPPNSLYGG